MLTSSDPRFLLLAYVSKYFINTAILRKTVYKKMVTLSKNDKLDIAHLSCYPQI